MAEWGERQSDGSVIVYSDEGGVVHEVRRESWEQNQGFPGPMPSGGSGITTYPSGLVDQQLAALQQEYLRERLRLVDVPGLELEKHRLALDKASKFAQLSGWMVPSSFLEQSLQGTGVVPPQVSPEDMANIRNQLAGAGWPGGSDQEAADAFLRTVDRNDTNPAQQQLLQRLSSGGGGQSPGGMLPTMEMANLLGNPRNIGQSLIMLGNTPQQAGNLLNSMPLVRGLQGYPGVSFGGGWGQPSQSEGSPAGNPNWLMGEDQMNRNAPSIGGASPTAPNWLMGEDQMNRNAPSIGGASPWQQSGLIPQGQEGTRNPFFQFVSGRHIPAQQGMNWMSTNSQMVPLISGLASFSGQDPNAFWGEWQSFLPKGSKNPLSSFI